LLPFRPDTSALLSFSWSSSRALCPTQPSHVDYPGSKSVTKGRRPSSWRASARQVRSRRYRGKAEHVCCFSPSELSGLTSWERLPSCFVWMCFNFYQVVKMRDWSLLDSACASCACSKRAACWQCSVLGRRGSAHSARYQIPTPRPPTYIPQLLSGGRAGRLGTPNERRTRDSERRERLDRGRNLHAKAEHALSPQEQHAWKSREGSCEWWAAGGRMPRPLAESLSLAHHRALATPPPHGPRPRSMAARRSRCAAASLLKHAKP
jgi:hypothetical protein